MKTGLYISTIFVWITNVFVYYLFSYPEHFPLYDVITKQVEWKLLLSIYFTLISIAVLLSYALYKKVSFLKKVFASIICINAFVMILMLSYGGYRFYNNRKALNYEIVSFQNEAYQDIKNDKIKDFGGGLALPPKNEIELEKLKKKTLN